MAGWAQVQQRINPLPDRHSVSVSSSQTAHQRLLIRRLIKYLEAFVQQVPAGTLHRRLHPLPNQNHAVETGKMELWRMRHSEWPLWLVQLLVNMDLELLSDGLGILTSVATSPLD